MVAYTTEAHASDHAHNALLEKIWTTATIHPEASAFTMLGQEPLTYAGLWNLSGRIANKLHKLRTGEKPVPVIVIGDKSNLMIATLIGCLRAGHAYVPVTVSMPSTRVESMREQLKAAFECDPTVLVTLDHEHADVHSESDYVFLPEVLKDNQTDRTVEQLPFEPECWVTGEETQYIIFTSGSTGKPKGIEVTENDVANFMDWLNTFPTIREGSKVFMDQAPYSFDLSEFEVIGALSTGGCLYGITPDAATDMRHLFEELKNSNMDVWVSTPPFADMCLADPGFNRELLPKVSLFLFCGDYLTHRVARALKQRFPEAVVANTYGPTESTVAVTYCEITDEMLKDNRPLPVGYPRPRTELVIRKVKEAGGPLGEVCKPGESGEVVIVGDTVAKDYLGQPEKTTQAFSEAKLGDGTPVRAFRTGDLAHLDEQGLLHYEGRMGTLIKLNGFRIELGDIENHLRGIDGVDKACVIPMRRQGRISALKAFVVLDDKHKGKITPRAIKQTLSKSVPAYMVPRLVKILDALPLTNNGKIDRKDLK